MALGLTMLECDDSRYEAVENSTILKVVVIQGLGVETPALSSTVHFRHMISLAQYPKVIVIDKLEKLSIQLMSHQKMKKAWLTALGTMRRGEIAQFKCNPHETLNQEELNLIPEGQNILLMIKLENFIAKNAWLINSISKTVLKSGSGYKTPTLGSDVEVKFSGYCNGRKFHSSLHSDDPRQKTITFRLGDLAVEDPDKGPFFLPFGVLLALKDFKLGEKSKVIIKPEFAFEAGHYGWKIPPYVDVEYDVKLVAFTPTDEDVKFACVESFLRQAQRLYDLGKFHTACMLFQRVVKWLHFDNDYSETWEGKKTLLSLYACYNSATCYLRLRRYKDAAIACSEALMYKETSSEAYYKRAIANFGLATQEGEHQAKFTRENAKCDLFMATKTQSSDFAYYLDRKPIKSKFFKKLTLEELLEETKQYDVELFVYSSDSTNDATMECVEKRFEGIDISALDLPEYNTKLTALKENNEDLFNLLNFDITEGKNLGILKQQIREGTGSETPTFGCFVQVQIDTCRVDGTQIESSRGDNQPIEFNVGVSDVLMAWQYAVKTMKKGEISQFYCHPSYCYGKNGKPPKIRPHESLKFEIELIGWVEKDDLTPNKDGGVIRMKIKAGEGFSSPAFGRLVQISIVGMYEEAIFDERSVEFNLGTGESINVVEGIEIGLEKFRKGETSKLQIASKYAFADIGNEEFNVPPNADVEYTVELERFETVSESRSLNVAQRFERALLFKNQGAIYFKKDKFPEAIKLYNKALDFASVKDDNLKGKQLSEKNSLLLTCNMNLSLCYLKINKQKEVVEVTNKILEIDPKNLKALLRRGEAYLNMEMPADAINDFLEVMKIDPKNTEAAVKIIVCNTMITTNYIKQM